MSRDEPFTLLRHCVQVQSQSTTTDEKAVKVECCGRPLFGLYSWLQRSWPRWICWVVLLTRRCPDRSIVRMSASERSRSLQKFQKLSHARGWSSLKILLAFYIIDSTAETRSQIVVSSSLGCTTVWSLYSTRHCNEPQITWQSLVLQITIAPQ